MSLKRYSHICWWCVFIGHEYNTKHDGVCKSVTKIKDHAKNFPNAPRITSE